MAPEPFHIFDPRRNMHVQGFSGRAATTTLHDAIATGVSISGIFQAAEDFAVLCFYNAYDYFNHLRLKHLPGTDLSGLKLEFDIQYDHIAQMLTVLGARSVRIRGARLRDQSRWLLPKDVFDPSDFTAVPGAAGPEDGRES